MDKTISEVVSDMAATNSAKQTVGIRYLSDSELAAQYKHDLTLALQSVMEIMGRARANGLILGFSLSVDQFGKDFISGGGITVARYL